jgi:hypothetical protein
MSIDTNNLSASANGKEWQVLSVYQSIMDEEQVRKEKEKLHQKRMAFRDSLDKHLVESQKISNRAKEVDDRYLEHIKQDMLKHEEDEIKKRENARLKHERELKIRQDQIQEQRQRAQQERAAQEAIDLANVNLAKQKAREEQERIQQHRQFEKEKLKGFKTENEENKKRKLVEKQKEAELDLKLRQEYAAKLDADEKAREDLFLKKMHEMEIVAKKFENEGAGKIAKEEKIRFEQQLLREQEKKLHADLQREHDKEIQRKQMNHLANEENTRQLIMREKVKREEKEKDIQLKQQLLDQAQQYRQQEQEFFQKRKIHQEEYRSRLDTQKEELIKYDINLTGITAMEKKLNASTLDQIERNPEIMNKVLGRMQGTGLRKSETKNF